MIFHGDKLEHHDTPIHDFLMKRYEMHHENDPDNMAFTTAEDEKDSLTYGQLQKKIIQISEWFLENGYKKVGMIGRYF